MSVGPAPSTRCPPSQARRDKAHDLLQRGWQPHMSAPKYDPEQALVLCRQAGYRPGLVLLYEKKRLFREVLQVREECVCVWIRLLHAGVQQRRSGRVNNLCVFWGGGGLVVVCGQRWEEGVAAVVTRLALRPACYAAPACTTPSTSARLWVLCQALLRRVVA